MPADGPKAALGGAADGSRRPGGAPRRRTGHARLASGSSVCSAFSVDHEDVAYVKQYWSALSENERLALLSFKDRAIVDRAYAVQQALYQNELICYRSGIHFLNKDGTPVISMGLQMFRIKWPGGANEGPGAPEALAATREFVHMEDIFAYITQQMGELFGARPPAGGREDWAVAALEPAPHSWNEYERRVLRLIEWALLAGARRKKETALQSTLPLQAADVIAGEKKKKKAKKKDKTQQKRKESENHKIKKSGLDSADADDHEEAVHCEAEDNDDDEQDDDDEDDELQIAGLRAAEREDEIDYADVEGSVDALHTALVQDVADVVHGREAETASLEQAGDGASKIEDQAGQVPARVGAIIAARITSPVVAARLRSSSPTVLQINGKGGDVDELEATKVRSASPELSMPTTAGSTTFATPVACATPVAGGARALREQAFVASQAHRRPSPEQPRLGARRMLAPSSLVTTTAIAPTASSSSSAVVSSSAIQSSTTSWHWMSSTTKPTESSTTTWQVMSSTTKPAAPGVPVALPLPGHNVRRSTTNASIAEQQGKSYSAWLHNGKTGDAAQWHMVYFNPKQQASEALRPMGECRVTVKGTFLNVEPVRSSSAEPSRRRAKSWDDICKVPASAQARTSPIRSCAAAAGPSRTLVTTTTTTKTSTPQTYAQAVGGQGRSTTITSLPTRTSLAAQPKAEAAIALQRRWRSLLAQRAAKASIGTGTITQTRTLAPVRTPQVSTMTCHRASTVSKPQSTITQSTSAWPSLGQAQHYTKNSYQATPRRTTTTTPTTTTTRSTITRTTVSAGTSSTVAAPISSFTSVSNGKNVAAALAVQRRWRSILEQRTTQSQTTTASGGLASIGTGTITQTRTSPPMRTPQASTWTTSPTPQQTTWSAGAGVGGVPHLRSA